LILCGFLALVAKAAEPVTIWYVQPGEVLRFGDVEPGAVVEAALNGGLLRPAPTPFPSPTEGAHWLAFAARDQAGNLSPVQWVRLRVDGIAPDVILAVDPEPVADAAGALWLRPDALARAAAEDEGAGVGGMALEVNGLERTETGASLEAALPDRGEIRLEAWAVDRVGNRAAPVKLLASVDAAPPRVELGLEGRWLRLDDRLLAAPDVRVVAAVEDGESGLAEWRPVIDGAPGQPDDLGRTWAAGGHEVVVSAVDRVGNRIESPAFRFEVDAEPPELDWSLSPGLTSADGQVWRKPPTALSAAATDAGAGLDAIYWSDDGQSWQPLRGEVMTRRASIQLKAVDKLGNERLARATWRYDDAPPEIKLTLGGRDLPAGAEPLQLALGLRVETQVADSGVGVAQSRYTLDGKRWQPLPEAFIFYKPEDLVLEIEAEDRLGNSARRVWRFRIAGKSRGLDGGKEEDRP